MALTLVSMLAAVVATTTVTGIRAMRASDERRVAAAEAEYRLLTDWPQLGGRGERSGRTAGGVAWRITARSLASDPGGSGLCHVVSSASAGNGTRSYNLETQRFCKVAPP
jgi:hypothetical protein